MDVSVRLPADFVAIEDEWRALLVADPAATVFHTPEYARAWLAEFGEGRDVHLLEMRRGGGLTGLASLSRDPDGTLRFLGDLDTTDYLGPVSRPEDRDEVASALMRAAADLGDWRLFEMHGLAAGTGWSDALARAGKEAGFEVSERPQDSCPRVALAEGFEAYLAALPGKLRHEIRRKSRRLERELGEFRVRTAGPDTLEGDLARFFEMHRSSNGPKGKFLHEGMASFFARLARATLDAGWLRLSMLEVAGRSIAGVYAFSRGGVWSVYNSAFDHAFASASPGIVLMAETVRLAAQEGCGTFDLLRGREGYKYRLGASDLALLQVEVRRD